MRWRLNARDSGHPLWHSHADNLHNASVLGMHIRRQRLVDLEVAIADLGVFAVRPYRRR